jgi:ribonucleoside-diphosphate reductase alpha chain
MSKLTIDELFPGSEQAGSDKCGHEVKAPACHDRRKAGSAAKRRGFTQKAKINGQALFLRTGEYNDETLGEIFIDMARKVQLCGAC